jgi:aminomethyltransferase
MESHNLQRTPLFAEHQSLGGKIVPFAGWELPVQYSGVIKEHQAVRTAVGMFDVSHMGEITVVGKDAEQFLQRVTCNDLKKLVDGKGQYSALLNERGGVIDDLIVYRESATSYFICVNASNSDKDFAWLTEQHARGSEEVTLSNQSAQYALIALQGPLASATLEKLSGGAPFTSLKYFHAQRGTLAGAQVLVARTGYTGEDGFEIFIPTADGVTLWRALLAAGALPCGLGARDSLRLEACYSLHGHELGEDISALESGLSWIVSFDKGEFIGRQALAAEKERGSSRALCGFFITDNGIARQGDLVFSAEGAEIGVVTSGTKTPTVQRALGLALVDAPYAALHTSLVVQVRDKKLAATVVQRPFYKRGAKI